MKVPTPYRRLACLMLSLCLPGVAAAQMTVRDDLNRPLLVTKPAMRIVTLAPSLTELIFAAGAGDRVIGVAEHSDFPAMVKRLPQVYTGVNFRMEQLAGLKPDLVLAYRDGLRREDIETISKFGALVFVANARSLEDVPRLLSAIAVLTRLDVTDVISGYEKKLEALRHANEFKPRVSAFLEIWNRPLTTVSRGHFLSESLEICRAENVFAKIDGGSAPKVTWQEVQDRDPFVIIGAGSAGSLEEFRANWRMRRAIPAANEDRLIYLDSDAIQRPTIRTPDGIAILCAELDKMRAKMPAGLTHKPSEEVRSEDKARQFGM
jgi:iron complex transport system substrate-binding protein